MTAEDQARYLQEALAIARGTTHASPEEFARLQALARLLGDVLDALIWLENDVSEMPTYLYEQWGGAGSLVAARKAIADAGAWTEAAEQQANLAREREAELGPDLPSREERDVGEISSEFMDVPVSQGPHGVFSVETDEDLPRSPIPPTPDAYRGDTL